MYKENIFLCCWEVCTIQFHYSKSEPKKTNQKTKNDKLGDGKKFGHELINDETKNIYKKTKLFKGSGVMVIRSEVI